MYSYTVPSSFGETFVGGLGGRTNSSTPVQFHGGYTYDIPSHLGHLNALQHYYNTTYLMPNNIPPQYKMVEDSVVGVPYHLKSKNIVPASLGETFVVGLGGKTSAPCHSLAHQSGWANNRVPMVPKSLGETFVVGLGGKTSAPCHSLAHQSGWANNRVPMVPTISLGETFDVALGNKRILNPIHMTTNTTEVALLNPGAKPFAPPKSLRQTKELSQPKNQLSIPKQVTIPPSCNNTIGKINESIRKNSLVNVMQLFPHLMPNLEVPDSNDDYETVDESQLQVSLNFDSDTNIPIASTKQPQILLLSNPDEPKKIQNKVKTIALTIKFKNEQFKRKQFMTKLTT